MRLIIFLLFTFLLAQPVLSQQPTKKELQMEIQKQVADLKKEIADVEKQIGVAQKEDAESVKDLEQQLRMLKQQLATIEGVYKGVSGMSEKTFHDAASSEEENNSVPKRDLTRISTLPKTILSDAELVSFVKNVNTAVEKIIPTAEKAEALKIYNETKEKYNSTDITGNAASGCWMYGHWEKALYIMGRACLDDMTNTDNLNNYAAFLSMTGAEQAALPILQWLNKKYPENSTILNNIGQAWFGLGDMMNSKKYLDSVTILYGTHSMANATLSKIYESEGDPAKSIALLKNAIRENYDPEKEHELNRLGVELTFDDLPEFDYPMKEDPFGLIPFIESFPEEYQSAVGEEGKPIAIMRFLKGAKQLEEKLNDEDEILSKNIKERDIELASDSSYREEFLETHNTPAYKLAVRSLELLYAEMGQSSPLPIHLLFPLPKPFADKQKLLAPQKILSDCAQLYEDEVLKPLRLLAYATQQGSASPTCAEADAKNNAYLAKAAEIRRNGMKLIKKKFIAASKRLDRWIKLNLYFIMDKPPASAEDLTYALISYMDFPYAYGNAKKRMRNTEYHMMMTMARNFVKNLDIQRSSCETEQKPTPDPDADDLAPLVVSELKCEFVKDVKTPVGGFTLRCNTIYYDNNGKVLRRKTNVPKGQAQSSKKGSQNKRRGPLNNRSGGPKSFPYEFDETANSNIKSGPLNAEDKDLSQFSIEYDKWGNLVGLNVQLNADGTGLADPSSTDTGMDSRWSWNATGLPVKGFLNKLLIKKQ